MFAITSGRVVFLRRESRFSSRRLSEQLSNGPSGVRAEGTKKSSFINPFTSGHNKVGRDNAKYNGVPTGNRSLAHSPTDFQIHL